MKQPFMPRMAQAVENFLDTQPDYDLQASAAAVLLCYYFGWRSSTVAVVTVADL